MVTMRRSSIAAALPILILLAPAAEADNASAPAAPPAPRTAAAPSAVPTWLRELPAADRVLSLYPHEDPPSYALLSAVFAVLADVVEVRSSVDQSLMGAALLARLTPPQQARWHEYVPHGYSKILTATNGSWQNFTSPQFRIQVLSRFIPSASIVAYETMRNRTPRVVGASTAADLQRIIAPPPAAPEPSEPTPKADRTAASGPIIPAKLPGGVTLPNATTIAWNEDIESARAKCGSLTYRETSESGGGNYLCDATDDIVLDFTKEGKLFSFSRAVGEPTFRRAVAELIRAYGTESLDKRNDVETWDYYYRNQSRDIIGRLRIGGGKSDRTSKRYYVLNFKPLKLPGSKVNTTPAGKHPFTDTMVPESFPPTYDIDDDSSLTWGEKVASAQAKCGKLVSESTLKNGGIEYYCDKGDVYLSFNSKGELYSVNEELTRQEFCQGVSEIVEQSGTSSQHASIDASRTYETWKIEYLAPNGTDVTGTAKFTRATAAKDKDTIYFATWAPR